MEEDARLAGFNDNFFGKQYLSVWIMGGHLVSLRRLQARNPRLEIAFFFEEKTVAIRKKEFHIAQLRTVDGWIVNLGQDAATNREPDASPARIGRADPILVGIRPPWFA